MTTALQVIERLEQAGFEVAVWDITSDVGIAAFYCLIVDRRDERAHSGGGAGAHGARGVALLRALTEAVQVRTTYIAGSRDDLHPERVSRLRRSSRSCAAPAALMAGRRAASATFARSRVTTARASPTTSPGCWRACGRSASSRSSAVDLTRPDFAIPVVRVVIPGLEGPDDHPRYVPGPRARAAGERRP